MKIKTEWSKLRRGLMTVPAPTFEDYTNVGKEDRTAFGLWYLIPRGMEIGSDLRNTNYSKVRKFNRKNYPIQYFFRYVLYGGLKKFFRDKVMGYYGPYWHHELTHRLFCDRQKWLRKTIPYTWRAYEGVRKEMDFATIVHVVEKEKILENFRWTGDEMDKSEVSDIENFFRKAYEIVTKEIPNTHKDLTVALDKSAERLREAKDMGLSQDSVYRYVYTDVNALTDKLNELEDEVIIGLAKHRKFLWV